MSFNEIYAMTLHEVNTYLETITRESNSEYYEAAMNHSMDMSDEIECFINVYESKFDVKPRGMELHHRSPEWLATSITNVGEM